jgi:hypothetical protein
MNALVLSLHPPHAIGLCTSAGIGTVPAHRTSIEVRQEAKMPDQPADPLHYEMKIPPEKHTPEKDSSDAGNTSGQSRKERPQSDSAGKEDDGEGSHAKPQTKHP